MFAIPQTGIGSIRQGHQNCLRTGGRMTRSSAYKVCSILIVFTFLFVGMVCMLTNDSDVGAVSGGTYNWTKGTSVSGTLCEGYKDGTDYSLVGEGISGSVPGITFTYNENHTGVFLLGKYTYSGTPTTAGTYEINVPYATNSTTYTDTLTYTIVVSEESSTPDVTTKYTVTFVSEGSTCGTVEVTAGESITSAQLPTPTKTKYTRTGWYKSETGNDKVTFPYTPTSNTTLYAHWTKALDTYSYSITYHGNGGTNGDSDTTGYYSIQENYGVTENIALIENPFTYDGYTFTGWLINGILYQPGYEYPVEADSSVSATAQWEKSTTPVTYYDHKITYMDGNKLLSYAQNSSTTDSGSVDIVIDYAPSKDGYTFIGWSITKDSTIAQYKYGSTVSVSTSGLILYAVWEESTTPVDTITVKIDGQSTTIPNGRLVSDLVIPTKVGYRFAGWYSDSSYENELADNIALKDGMTIYSKFVENEKEQEKTQYNNVLIASTMTLILGMVLIFVGYRSGNPVVIILGTLAAIFSCISIGIENGLDLTTWFSNMINGGRP